MPSRKVQFRNAEGLSLGARLDLPAGTPRAFALFAHCFTCNKNLRAVSRISDALVQTGIGVLRFDFTGLGESEGDFADTNFTTNVSDLLAAADHLAQIHQAPALLIGHSLGGAAVLQAASAIQSVQVVATIGAPADPGHVAHLFAHAHEEIESSGRATVQLAGRPFVIKRQFLEDLGAQRMSASIRALNRPLLIFHSPQDDIVPLDNATTIYKTADHPKSFVSLDGADHLLTDERDARYVGTVISSWASRYIESLQTTPATTRDSGGDLVAEIGPTGFRTTLQSGRHELLADEPTDVGGGDEGLSPYDFLNAALGSCTAMTLRMYADRKKWPLASVTVRLRHEKIHATDCDGCETTSGRVDQIERVLELRGDLSHEQRTRLVEIADRCPVHRTLHSEVRVLTRLDTS